MRTALLAIVIFGLAGCGSKASFTKSVDELKLYPDTARETVSVDDPPQIVFRRLQGLAQDCWKQPNTELLIDPYDDVNKSGNLTVRWGAELSQTRLYMARVEVTPAGAGAKVAGYFYPDIQATGYSDRKHLAEWAKGGKPECQYNKPFEEAAARANKH